MMQCAFGVGAFMLCGALGAAASHAQEASTEALLPTTPMAVSLTQEVWKLPAGETMGMSGGTLWWGVGEQMNLGVASYGATRGERGGFITLGVAGEYAQRWSPHWRSSLGLFVGAGGGRGGQPLAGGGLMLRTDLGLSYDTPHWGSLGLGVSHVRFPDGTIRSTQPYLRYDHRFNSLWLDGHTPPAVTYLSASGREGAKVKTRDQSFALVFKDVQMKSPLAVKGRMQLMGVEWTSALDENWFLKLESEGAMGGQSSGYMQILAGGGYRLPLWPGAQLLGHAALGPAGGGGVDTRGGLMGDVGLSLTQGVGRQNALALSWGKVGSLSGGFDGSSLGLKWVHHFSIPQAGAEPVRASALRGLDAHHLRMRLAQQTYRQAAPGWRNSYAHLNVDNLGVQLDYFLSPIEQRTQWFVTGQGLAAYKGEAGAYMTGLLGAGVHQALPGAWFAEAEALVGAAGGGGLATGGGLVGQINLGLGYRLSKRLSLMGTVGTMAAFRGDFRARVLGFGLVYDTVTFAGS